MLFPTSQRYTLYYYSIKLLLIFIVILEYQYDRKLALSDIFLYVFNENLFLSYSKIIYNPAENLHNHTFPHHIFPAYMRILCEKFHRKRNELPQGMKRNTVVMATNHHGNSEKSSKEFEKEGRNGVFKGQINVV